MPDMPSDWYCPYRIDHLEDQAITGYALGIDAVQALYLAMIRAGQTMADRPESLTFHDMPTFGLPRVIDQLTPVATAAAVEVTEDLGEIAGPALTLEAKARFEALLEEYRRRLIGSLTDLTEDEARRSLVPSRTTLLGLVKHLTYVETFYFMHRVTGQSLKDLGVASTPDRSFVLTDDDTIASVSAAYQRACAASQDAGRRLGNADSAPGGAMTSWDIYERTLRDLIQHCGHADILREQVIAARQRSSR